MRIGNIDDVENDYNEYLDRMNEAVETNKENPKQGYNDGIQVLLDILSTLGMDELVELFESMDDK